MYIYENILIFLEKLVEHFNIVEYWDNQKNKFIFNQRTKQRRVNERK